MSSERDGHATWRISSRTSRTNCTGVVRLRPWGRLRGWRAPPDLVAGAFRVAGDPSASTCPWRCIKRLVSRFTTLASHTSLSDRYVRGRAGGTRTPNRRFWRPVLYQLSYCPLSIAKTRTVSRPQGRDERLPPEPGPFPA